MKTNTRIAATLCGGLLALSSSHGATVSTFTGGDVGEGLDLDGSFAYAVNVSNNANAGPGPDFAVRDALFRDEYSNGQLIPGVTAYYQLLNNWGTLPTYGATANDTNLANVMHDIAIPMPSNHIFPSRLSLEMMVTGGQMYKLQAILNENFYGAGPGGAGKTREQDLVLYDGAYVDQVGTGRSIYDSASNVNVVSLVGAANSLTTGVVVNMEFTALADGTITLAANAPASPTGGLDVIPILSAVTLEEIPEPSVAALLGLGGLSLLSRRRR